MQTFMYVELNFFALVVLLLIFLNVYRQSERFLVEQKLFLTLIILNALILLFDSGMWALDGKKAPSVYVTYLIITTFYYILNPLICMIWAFYADFIIFRDEKHLKKIMIPLFIPVIFSTVLTLINFFNSKMFYIDSNNVYHRESLFYVMAAICHFYLIYTLIKIIINRRKVENREFLTILVFAFPPFAVAIIQGMVYGVSFIWVSVTISLMIIFINIQNAQLYTDYLTGLFNRRQLDLFLQERFGYSSSKTPMAGIMIDINSFKYINDMFGHHVGDQALKHTANILKKTFDKDDFIARFGGDEFIVLSRAENNSKLTEYIEKLKVNVSKFNEEEIIPYEISLSMGYDFFDFRSGMTPEDFLKRIDKMMYENKQNNLT